MAFYSKLHGIVFCLVAAALTVVVAQDFDYLIVGEQPST